MSESQEDSRNIVHRMLEDADHGLPGWLFEELSALKGPPAIQVLKAARLVCLRVLKDGWHALRSVAALNKRSAEGQFIADEKLSAWVYGNFRTLSIRAATAMYVIKPVLTAFEEVADPPHMRPELGASCYMMLPILNAWDAQRRFEALILEGAGLGLDFDTDIYSNDLKEAVLEALCAKCALPWAPFADFEPISPHHWRGYANHELIRAARLVHKEGLLAISLAQVVPVTGKGAFPEKKVYDIVVGGSLGWKQESVNKAVWNYVSQREGTFEIFKEAIEQTFGRRRRDIISRARGVFGRNALSQALRCPPAMISKSPAWKNIKSELRLTERAGHRGRRMGLEIAGELAAMERHEDPHLETDEEIDRETELQRLIAEQQDDDRFPAP